MTHFPEKTEIYALRGLNVEELISDKILGKFCLPVKEDGKIEDDLDLIMPRLGGQKCVEKCVKKALCDEVRRALLKLYAKLRTRGKIKIKGPLIDGSSHVDDYGIEIALLANVRQDHLDDSIKEIKAMLSLDEAPLWVNDIVWEPFPDEKQGEQIQGIFMMYHYFLELFNLYRRWPKIGGQRGYVGGCPPEVFGQTLSLLANVN